MKRRLISNENAVVFLIVVWYFFTGIIGSAIGQQISYMIWNDYYVDETPYVNTLLANMLDIVVIILFKKVVDIQFAQKNLKEDITLYATMIIGIAAFSSGAFAISEMLDLQGSAWDSVSEVSHWLKLSTVVVIGPLSEELVFRGAIFGTLRKGNSFFFCAIISSTIFAIAHGVGAAAINAFGLGMFLCLAFEKSGSMLVGTVVHITNNCLALITTEAGVSELQEGEMRGVISAVVPLAISIFIYVMTYRDNRKREI